MLRIFWNILRALASAVRSRRELLQENLALRQQLAAFKARGKQPRIRAADRTFWLVLRRLWSRWGNALVIVKPDTVVRWHRAGFNFYWNWISRRGARLGRPPVDAEIRDLVRKMATDNGWGAPRVHGELRMLGFEVTERTVSRYLHGLRRRPEARQSWLTFLRNHREVIASMDLFVVCTATFRLLYVLFVIRHGRREIAHFNVTQHPTAAWVAQQIRETFPFDPAPNCLVFDRDSTFSAEVVAAVKVVGAKPTRTSYRAPWQNGTAERWFAGVRAELLDRVIVLDEAHLRRLLRDYVAYHHQDRTRCGLGKETPMQRAVEPRPSPTATVVGLARVGGLHRRHVWREAAYLALVPLVRHLATVRGEMMAACSVPRVRAFPVTFRRRPRTRTGCPSHHAPRPRPTIPARLELRRGTGLDMTTGTGSLLLSRTLLCVGTWTRSNRTSRNSPGRCWRKPSPDSCWSPPPGGDRDVHAARIPTPART
jgi:putative transposase